MALLGAVTADQASADTTNNPTSALQAFFAATVVGGGGVTFTAPANGAVLVKINFTVHGATTFPQILVGIAQSSPSLATIARVAPMGAHPGALATTQMRREAVFVVSGLTPGNSYTWNIGYGVETIVASTAIKYGGPNNTTTNDAFGAIVMEIWEAANLLGSVLYDPAVAVTKATTALAAMTAIDTTNARITFTAPASGNVLWRVRTVLHGSTTIGQVLLGVMEGATVRGRISPITGGQALATSLIAVEGSGVITGLTPGNSYSFDAAYGVEIVAGAGGGLKYGGPDNATANDAFGALCFEIWTA